MGNKTTKKMSVAALAMIFAGTGAMNYVQAATQTITTTRTGSTTGQSDADYTNWKTNNWTGKEDGALDSGRIMLTPGKTQNDINMAWYSKAKGTPAVMLSLNSDMRDASVYTGKATAINKTNGANTYLATNKVSINNALKEGKTYYYKYCDDTEIGTYSKTYSFKTAANFNSYKAILVGDPQIGASGSSGQTTLDDKNVAIDTYNWNKTLTTATTMFPTASFILSAGDQIDYSTTSGYDIREREYAGFTYPSALRSYPLASTIGNHESLGDDYQLHYNTPNASSLGATTSGGDYYYSYGNTLYIVLNTNNRNASEHDQFMKEALASDSDAKWKVVMFHHDIYGSASSHSDIDGANLRILFAPLMDKYNIDVCLTGHDHQYARTYQIIDGKVIDYNGDGSTVSDPEGTMYITAGSASGSKYYSLNSTAQYYLAERVSDNTPSFSTVSVTDTSLKIETYDYNGNSYANPFTINKGVDKASIQDVLKDAESIDKDTLSEGSTKRMKSAVAEANTLLDTRDDTTAIEKLSNEYNRDPDSGSLSYYAYASVGGKALAEGFSALLDKTLYEDAVNTAVSSTALQTAKNKVETAIRQNITKSEIETVKKAIKAGEDVLANGVEGTTKGQYKVGSKATLKTVLDTAYTEIANVDLDNDGLSKISANVKEALSAFENAKVTKNPDVNVPGAKPQVPGAKPVVKPETPDGTTSKSEDSSDTSNKTLAVTPKTGDTSNVLALGSAALLSLAGLGYFSVHKLKNRYAAEEDFEDEDNII